MLPVPVTSTGPWRLFPCSVRLLKVFTRAVSFLFGGLVILYIVLPHPFSFSTRDTPHPSSLYATRLEDETLRSRDKPSTAWAPMVVRTCSQLTPAWFAPCIAARTSYSDRMYAEELVYPDFVLPLPLFPDDEQKQQWIDMAKSHPRATYDNTEQGEFMVYKSMHGQNFVIHNVTFTPPAQHRRFNSWNASNCMMAHTRLGHLNLSIPAAVSSSAKPIEYLDSAIVATTPDSWSFQHFLDRVTHTLAQSAHLSSVDWRPIALTGRNGSVLVNQLWDRLGFRDRIHAETEPLSLGSLTWSCKTPLIHPYLSWKTLELMEMPWTTHHGFNGSTKKTVSTAPGSILYMSRSDGRATNAGRRVVNEEDVFSAIDVLLKERDQGETLQAFNPEWYPTLESLVQFFTHDVLAIVGPHGGALMNHRFAGPGVLMVEFLPASQVQWINWEEVSMLNQTYAAIIAEPVADTHDDMVVEPAQVVDLLSRHLGSPGRLAGTSYMWDKE